MNVTRLLVGPVFCALLVVACAGSTTDTTPGNLPEMLGRVAEARSKAEDAVSAVKIDHSEGLVPATSFSQMRSQYGDAKAAFDGWIATLEAAMREGTSLEQSPQYEASLQRALNETQSFVDSAGFVHILADAQRVQAPQGARGAPPPEAIAGGVAKVLLPALADVGVTLWREYRDASKEKRDEIIQSLDAARFRSFDEIGVIR
jgi:hypothetical protein